MLYAQAYAARKNCDEPISLSLYSLRRLMLEPVGPYKIRIAPFRPQTESDIALKQMPRSTKWRILDYRDYSPQLNRLLIGHLNELFPTSRSDVPTIYHIADSAGSPQYAAPTKTTEQTSQHSSLPLPRQ